MKKKHMNQKKTLEIDHIELAAVLLTLEYKVERVDRSNPKRCKFIIHGKEDSSHTINQFFNSELLVEPKKLFANLRVLKNLVHNSY